MGAKVGNDSNDRVPARLSCHLSLKKESRARDSDLGSSDFEYDVYLGRAKEEL